MSQEQHENHYEQPASTATVDGQQDAPPAVEGVVEPAPGTAPSTDELTVLRARLAEAEQQAAEYKDQWMRAVADFKNLKRRTDAERIELIQSASSKLVLKVLPVVDDFERAVMNIPAEIAETPWWGGTQLIGQKLRTILESEGVKPIEALGKDFDPNFHDALLYEDAPGQEGKVIAVLQQGYMINDRVLRPASVKVGRG
ncbi:MAG: nucleotide exchange factor GrpE [Chloroflexaceae bacterium]|nr:nucleotide exchange factor GrpE [Chloroflexaceae bacterium]